MTVMTAAKVVAKKTGAGKAPAPKSAAGGKAPAPAGAPPASRQRAAAKAKDLQRRAAASTKASVKEGLKAPEFPLSGASGSAHRIVVAEFALCVILVGMTPVVMRNPQNGHLYTPNDFVRLSALCLVFFVLALMSNNPKSSRVAAAFGALVTLGVLYNASGSLAAIGSIFVNSSANKGKVNVAPEGTDTYDVASYTPGLTATLQSQQPSGGPVNTA